MSDLISYREVRARRQHQCSTCLATIPTGGPYWRAVCAAEGTFYTFKSCGSCTADKVGSRVLNWCSHPDDGYDADDCLEWARETVRAEACDDTDAARRYLARHPWGAES